MSFIRRTIRDRLTHTSHRQWFHERTSWYTRLRDRFRRLFHRKRTAHEWLRFAWSIVFVAFAVFFISMLGGIVFLMFIARSLPTTAELVNYNAVESTKILDRYGNLLYEVHGDERRTNVSLENISPYVVQATLAAEDDEFYVHPGFDWKAIVRAGLSDVVSMAYGGSGRVQGASTITQQFVRNAYLSREKTYTRKLKELLLALQVERHFTKDEILELYLNTVSYGSNVYGVETAAQAFFEKDARDLTLAEGAVLAAVVQRPSYYSPYGSHLDELIGRTNDYVLVRMRKLGMISEAEFEEARDTVLTFAPYRQEITAPHFVFYVREYLEEAYGKDVVEQGGLRVYTTIDHQIQNIAELAITEQAQKNLEQYKADNLALISMNPKNGDILAMVGSKDYFDSEIDGQVNVITSDRQPGSSFKPFVYANAFLSGFGPGTVVYDVKTNFGNYEPENYDGRTRGPVSLRTALGNSLNIPAVKVIHLGGVEGALDLANRMGITTVNALRAEELGLSAALGVAEVRPLDMAAAYSAFANGGKRATPRSILRVEDQLGTVLEEVSGFLPPKEREAIEETLTDEVTDEVAGERDPEDIVTDEQGLITSLYELLPDDEEFALRDQVLDPQAAYLVNNILSDEHVKLSLHLSIPGRSVATKTGTANKKKNNVNVPSDGWTIGYTPSIVTVVWAGNTDGAALNAYADGTTIAAPVWKSFMTQALKDQPVDEFVRPPEIREIAVSTMTGLLPSAGTPPDLIRSELWASYSVPTVTDEGIVSAEVDAISGKLATDFTPEYSRVTYVYENHHSILYYLNQEDPQFPRWEPPVRKWAVEERPIQILQRAGVLTEDNTLPPDYIPGEITIDGHRYKYVVSLDQIPTEYDTIHDEETAENAPHVTILQPDEGGRMAPGANEILLEVTGERIDRVELYFDSELMDIITRSPYAEGRVVIPDTIELGSTHKLSVHAYNRVQDRSVTTVNVTMASDAKPPELTLRRPNTSRRYQQGDVIPFEAYVVDDRSGVREVEFIIDGRPVKIFTSDIGTYEFDYLVPDDLAPGMHDLVVRAFDNESNVARIDQKIEVEAR